MMQSLPGQLDIYTYSYAGEFDLANENNVLLYTGNVTPSEYGNKVSFTDALTAGNKIVAVLTLNGGESRVVKVSRILKQYRHLLRLQSLQHT